MDALAAGQALRCGLSLTIALGLTTTLVALDAARGQARAAVRETQVAAPVASTADPAPARSAPGYTHHGGYSARIRPGGGPTETSLRLPVASNAHLLWGDWWDLGTESPVVFRGGLWTFYTAGFGVPQVAAKVSFGTRGDRPVVGDWDGDSRADLAVVRGTTWHLAADLRLDSPTIIRAAATWRRFRFGPPGGQPVAGNFDGRGADGIATYLAGRWWVRQHPSRGAAVRREKFAFASRAPRRAAIAVAGDWSGTGRDGVALVRGERWRFTPFPGAPVSESSRRRIVRPAGSRPTTWRTFAGPGGDRCPWATGLPRPRVPAAATPGLHPDQTSDVPTATERAQVREALTRAERFMLAGRASQPWALRDDQRYADVLAGDRRLEYAVRRPAMAALAVAVTVATGAHDAATADVSRAVAVSYVEATVRSIACQHRSVSPGGWGHGWQTGHWAQLTAQAAWLLWNDLSPATRADVAAMLLDEAGHQLHQPAEYWRDRDGLVLPGREGDTAAEEMAWDVALLELAHIMFPTAPGASEYRRHAVQWAVAAYAAPADLQATEPVNGVSPALRLRGTNALDDGTVVNHHRVEPDYMSNIQHLWWAADFAQLARTSTPAAVWHNARLVYGAFSTVHFTPGDPSAADNGRTYVEPGGTIYRPGSDALYYPDGTNWGTVRRAPFMSLDAHALAYDRAPVDARPAAEALAAHTEGQLALSQASGESGATYSLDPAKAAEQDSYKGREEYAAQQVATAWLALHLAAWGPPPLDEGTYAVPTEALVRQPVAPRRAASP